MTADDLRLFDPYTEVTQTENRLPHWQQAGNVYFVTFRLADSMPKSLLEQWNEERVNWQKQHPEPRPPELVRAFQQQESERVELWLDRGHGACPLREPGSAAAVGKALSFFEGGRTSQIAWVVMPNHVHALFSLHEPHRLETILASWKRNAAREINQRQERSGELWQRDYFDRLIRDRPHLANCVRYIRRNPSKANLRPGEYLLWESELAQSIE